MARSAILALALIISAAGCSLPPSAGAPEPTMIVYDRSQLTLSWDPPLSNLPGFPSAIASYRVYYHERGRDSWIPLGEVKASGNPQYTIDHAQVGNGVFAFAVRAITAAGKVSDLHTSLDPSAEPISGWYVLWVQSH